MDCSKSLSPTHTFAQLTAELLWVHNRIVKNLGNSRISLAKIENEGTLGADHLGSVRLVVRADTGAIAQAISYDEFGRVLSDSSPGFQAFGFAGGLYDHQTSLVRFGARDYDPEVGRWVSKDPILFNGGQANLYSYIEDEPINQVDPMGTGPSAALTCAASLLVFSTPAILDSAYNNYEIERLKSAKSSTSDCPPTAKNNIDNQIEKLRDQNRAADEYMQSLTDMRGICYSLIFTPGP